MFDSIEKARQLRQVVQDPTESELVGAITEIISVIEHRQLSAVEDLHETLGTDGVEVESDQEERKQQLLDLVGALSNGEFTKWWFEEVGAEHLRNPEDAVAYAGLSEEEWQNQISRWAEQYRQADVEGVDKCTDREVASLHVGSQFGCSLPEFEREVVGYDRQEAMRTVLAGNFEAVESGIRAADAALKEAKATASEGDE